MWFEPPSGGYESQPEIIPEEVAIGQEAHHVVLLQRPQHVRRRRGTERDDVHAELRAELELEDDVLLEELIELASERGRRTRPHLKIGVCGEQGGDPNSIRFFEHCRLDSVSCSPFRVPIARLASARAGLG